MVILNKAAENNYSFNITSETGQVLFYSVTFRTEEEVSELIQKMEIALDDNFSADRRTDPNGQFFFTLKNNLGHIVGHSNLYDSEPGMENGIENLKKALH